MEPGASPRTVTSKRSIKYRKSLWNVHTFEVWSGELVCRVVSLKMEESLLLWLGGAGQAMLGEVALAFPSQKQSERAVSTTLLAGGGGEAQALALRLAAAVARPVWVCSALPLDRFSATLVEHGLVLEMKFRPECF